MGEGVPCRELVTEVMKEGGKVRKGRTVVHETTQSLAKAGSCSHPRAGGTQGGSASTRGSTLQSRAQEPGCQSGDHRACVLIVDSPCLLCLWLCGAPCIVFTCFWLSTCLPHRQHSGLFPDTWNHVPVPSVHGNSHTVPALPWWFLLP